MPTFVALRSSAAFNNDHTRVIQVNVDAIQVVAVSSRQYQEPQTEITLAGGTVIGVVETPERVLALVAEASRQLST
ncbi:MAG: hypothetical protein HY329_01235 [Chloroflexi bacterium]|nr:hypothetical protein [Chloroflexota bacterium]